MSAGWNLAQSRIVQIVAAFAIAWVMSWWNTRASWQETLDNYKSEQAAAIAAAVAQDANTAQEIAAAATKRVADDTIAISNLSAEIEALKQWKAEHPDVVKTTGRDCRITGDYVKWLRRFDATARASRRNP
ncbi:hypothetical protein D1O30_06780 [Methylocystis hirsuta]|uniref:Uncharacterized protein n=1 Tax=Methylocystis hirsuta TaxID=369798 RepID=A0A3M9XM49_9HYPH|nr:hypothetical protein D1O30_06780 [Methylocystis hirsuta]